MFHRGMSSDQRTAVSRETRPTWQVRTAADLADQHDTSTTRRLRWPRPPSTRVLARSGGLRRRAPPARARPRHGRRQPEGRRRQDHHDRERRRRPGSARPRVLVIDLDPQGNASTALGVAHHRACRRRTTCWSTAPLADGSTSAPISLVSGWCRPPSTSPAPRSSWSAWWPASSGSPGDQRPPARRDGRGGRGRPLRLRARRLPAVARSADPQRAGGGTGDVHPDPGGVLRPRGTGPAAGDGGDGRGSTSTRGWSSRRSC